MVQEFTLNSFAEKRSVKPRGTHTFESLKCRAFEIYTLIVFFSTGNGLRPHATTSSCPPHRVGSPDTIHGPANSVG